MNTTEHLGTTAGLKAGDYVKVLSNQPAFHLCTCYGGMDIKREDVRPEEFIAIINAVIDDQCCYVTTVRPSGYNLIADLDEMICKVAPGELSEEEREKRLPEYMTAVNRYVNTETTTGSTKRECERIAKRAVESLFPDADIDEIHLQDRSWFRTKDIIATVDDLLNNFGDSKGRSAEDQALLKDMREDFIRGSKKCRYKQYHTVYVGIKMPKALLEYWLVPVAMDFSDAFVLRNIDERGLFFRSLGPEFSDMEDALNYFRQKCMETSIQPRGN